MQLTMMIQAPQQLKQDSELLKIIKFCPFALLSESIFFFVSQSVCGNFLQPTGVLFIFFNRAALWQIPYESLKGKRSVQFLSHFESGSHDLMVRSSMIQDYFIFQYKKKKSIRDSFDERMKSNILHPKEQRVTRQ